MRRLVLWQGVNEWRAEACHVDLQVDGLSATGTQMGITPVPYRLEYELEAGPNWATRRLTVETGGAHWSRRLELLADGEGNWRVSASQWGSAELAPPGGDPQAIHGALDCDLGRSPLTNTMPIRRHDLHRSNGSQDFVMAWVSVPDLRVIPARQRYEHVYADSTSARVRYIGEHRGFKGELLLDADAIVTFYPEMASQVTAR